MSKRANESEHTWRARILVVEDHDDTRALLEAMLSDRWEVEAVSDGVQGLTAARANPPDLILSDVSMPGLDGLALLRALRQNAKTQTIPVVLVSARIGEAATIEGLESGADDYVVKPFSSAELVTRVSTQLALARLRRESAVSARARADELNQLLGQARRAASAREESMRGLRAQLAASAERLQRLHALSVERAPEQGWLADELDEAVRELQRLTALLDASLAAPAQPG
jgi:DNA-binding response OmpR family regulator